MVCGINPDPPVILGILAGIHNNKNFIREKENSSLGTIFEVIY